MKTRYTEDVHQERASSGPSLSGADRPTLAKIDLGALTHNYQEVVRRAGKRKILAVVKAQAYGHGAIRVSQHLLGLGADMLGVAFVEEGRELREGGIQAPVLVMGAIFPEQAEALVRLGLTPLVYNDTIAKDFIARIRKLDGIRIEGLMTHFADADLKDKQFASKQMDRFETLMKALAAQGITIPICHAANSAAVLDFDRAFFTMVRPGLMLYGYNPLEAALDGPRIDVRPVLSLVTRIAFLKRTPAGVPISYGRTFVTKRESLIATTPVGYADGYARGLSNRGEALVRGTRVPVAGRVCMDMTMLDVTDVPGVREGDDVVLIGAQGGERITAEDIATKTGTIPYEVLCGISSRVPRVYV